MRKSLLVVAALLAATPAVAQPQDYVDDYDVGAPAVDIADVGRVAGTLERLVGALMELPVGGIAAAVDPLGRGGVHPGDTVRDLAERDDPYAEQRIRAGIRGSARGIGAMSEAFARMVPVLRRSVDELRDSVAAAIDEVETREPY